MRKRRVIVMLLISVALGAWITAAQTNGVAVEQPQSEQSAAPTQTATSDGRVLAAAVLETLAVKGRAPKTGYARTQFGDGWATVGNCDTRNIILHRDLAASVVSDECKVMGGTLYDPYTGATVSFVRGATTSALVQIDHVVALSNAWQTGAQQLTLEQRVALANDPLELLAVDGDANQKKSDGDAATWLPANKAFRCQYVARQIAVKQKYALWVTPPEKTAMQTVLSNCPEQAMP